MTEAMIQQGLIMRNAADKRDEADAKPSDQGRLSVVPSAIMILAGANANHIGARINVYPAGPPH